MVAIVEDDRPTREGLALLIDGTPGYRCSGKYGSINEALRELNSDIHDVILVDVHLPGISGSDGVNLLRQKYTNSQIVMLTAYSEDSSVFESICNGACGYLLKKTPPARLLESIREAHEGGAPMSPEIARKVVTLFQKTAPIEKVDQNLTPQETKLLSLLAQGHSYQAAANQLNISVNTVRNYIRSVYEKLHVHSKSEAVSKALRNRLIF